MFNDEFKKRYTTIPFAVYKADGALEKEVISHQHNEVELISVIEGNADFYIDTRHYALKKGDILVIPPFSIHRAIIRSEVPTSYHCICFDISLLWDEKIKLGLATHALSVSDAVRNDAPCAKKMQEWIALGFDACKNGGNGWELEAIGSMSLVFSALMKNGYFTSARQSEKEIGFAQKAMNYISENYAEPITSSTAAASLYINSSYFCRMFKKTFGFCFSDYLLAYRLEKAKTYLTDKDHSKITDISFRVGFNSCSYFSKAFRERFGYSPLSYRKMLSE